MKVSASFARAEDGMVVATVVIRRTDNDPAKLTLALDGEKVPFTTEGREHTVTKSFSSTDAAGADRWAKKLSESIRKQVDSATPSPVSQARKLVKLCTESRGPCRSRQE